MNKTPEPPKAELLLEAARRSIRIRTPDRTPETDPLLRLVTEQSWEVWLEPLMRLLEAENGARAAADAAAIDTEGITDTVEYSRFWGVPHRAAARIRSEARRMAYRNEAAPILPETSDEGPALVPHAPADDLKIITDAASNWATELTDYVIPFAKESDTADAQRYEAERDAIQCALGRYLDEVEGQA